MTSDAKPRGGPSEAPRCPSLGFPPLVGALEFARNAANVSLGISYV